MIITYIVLWQKNLEKQSKTYITAELIFQKSLYLHEYVMLRGLR